MAHPARRTEENIEAIWLPWIARPVTASITGHAKLIAHLLHGPYGPVE